MSGSSWKRNIAVLAAGGLVLAGTKGASAAVTFAALGGNLVVTIDAPIHFSITSATTSRQFALIFEDVYTTASNGHHGDVPISGTSTLTLAGGVVSDGLDTWSDIGTTLGVLAPTDFYATFFFNSDQIVQVGDTVAVAAGIVTIEGFITSGGLVPDRMPTSIHLIDESLNELSAPMAVPEPKAALLGGLGLLVLLMRRR